MTREQALTQAFDLLGNTELPEKQFRKVSLEVATALLNAYSAGKAWSASKPTVGDKVRFNCLLSDGGVTGVTANQTIGEATGRIVSGPSEQKIYRVQLDKPQGPIEYVYRFVHELVKVD